MGERLRLLLAGKLDWLTTGISRVFCLQIGWRTEAETRSPYLAMCSQPLVCQNLGARQTRWPGDEELFENELEDSSVLRRIH